MTGVKALDSSLELPEHLPCIRKGPADSIAMVAADGSTVNDPAADLIETLARKQQVAHLPLPSAPPNALGEDSCSWVDATTHFHRPAEASPRLRTEGLV